MSMANDSKQQAPPVKTYHRRRSTSGHQYDNIDDMHMQKDKLLQQITVPKSTASTKIGNLKICSEVLRSQTREKFQECCSEHMHWILMQKKTRMTYHAKFTKKSGLTNLFNKSASSTNKINYATYRAKQRITNNNSTAQHTQSQQQERQDSRHKDKRQTAS